MSGASLIRDLQFCGRLHHCFWIDPIPGHAQSLQKPLSSDGAVWPHAGVVEGIMGMNVGEKRALESVVGDAWWEPEGLAGVPVRCDVTLREIFEWDLAEVWAP